MKQRISVLVDPGLRARLNAIRARTGLSDSEQIRRGIAMWLESMSWPIRDDERPLGKSTSTKSDLPTASK